MPSGMAGAAVIASTDFDGRTASGTTASNITWVRDGVADPGDLTVTGAPSLFNGNALVQNMFAPGINTGNGNTSWVTTIPLTVTGGATVTLTDVSFDNWSINSGQNQNVNRRNDFTVRVLSPAAVELDSVDIVDSVSGTVAGAPNVTATFAAPIALSAPGTYTVEIRGGDFLGGNETGNHTAIDNLSINGDIAPVPEPSAFIFSALGCLALARRRR